MLRNHNQFLWLNGTLASSQFPKTKGCQTSMSLEPMGTPLGSLPLHPLIPLPKGTVPKYLITFCFLQPTHGVLSTLWQDDTLVSSVEAGLRGDCHRRLSLRPVN